MGTATLDHADVVLDRDGIPYCPEFGDIYHPAGGAGAQARHVFLAGNALPQRWRGRHSFTIVETGFGLGLNFLETWRAVDDDPRGPRALHFVSVENRPPSRASLAALQARWPDHAARSRELVAAWPLPLAGFHRLHFADGRITLTLLFGDARDLLPQLEARADAFFLDGFAPAKNPQLWSPEIFSELARLAAPNATLATWTVAAAVRDGLAAAGFGIEKRAGFGGKREMLTGLRPQRHADAAHPVVRTGANRSAIVIGAGLAGCMAAERLAARGWEVEVLDRQAAPAQGASGNPVALASPLVNFADEANARLSRACFLYAHHYYTALQSGEALQREGILRIARGERDAQRFAQLLERLDFPREFAGWADVGDGARLAGRAVSHPGIWFPGGMVLAPGVACATALARWPGFVRWRQHARAARLDAFPSGWRVLDANGALIATAPLVVLACGLGISSFSQAAGLPLERIRGQITLLPYDATRRLDIAITGDRHAVRLPDGRCMIGATFQPGDDDPAVRTIDHADNLRGVEAMLPGFCAGIAPDSTALVGRAGIRAATPDRLPLYGRLPQVAIDGGAMATPPTLLIAGGLGARGLVWAPLGAELLAAQLDGEPWPLPRDLAQSVDPRRFGVPPNARQ